MNDHHFQWTARLDAVRPTPETGFGDLIPIVAAHYQVHEQADAFLGPYNAKQRNSKYPYQAPDRELLRQVIKLGRMNDFSYSAYLNSLIRFCETHKGFKALPGPHPSTIHSIQLPLPAFKLQAVGDGKTEVYVAGAEVPLVVRGLRDLDSIKFIIVRPKLGRNGSASASKWEVLFFKTNVGYLPDWADSMLNPKYAGSY